MNVLSETKVQKGKASAARLIDFHINAAVCFLLTLEGGYFFSLCLNFFHA